MKWNVKKISIIIYSLIFTLGIGFNSVTASAVEKKDISIQNFNRYVHNVNSLQIGKNEEDVIVRQLPAFLELLEVDSNSSVSIGQGIICYNLDTREKVYYYPIYIDNECLLMAEKADSSNIAVSTDTRLYEQLHNIDFNDSVYLLNIYDGKLFIESQDEKVLLVDYTNYIGISENSQKEFDTYNFQQKIDFIEKQFNCNLIETTANKNIVSNLDIRGDSLYALPAQKILDISKAAVIQKYNNCWAAVSATVINHKNGSVGPVQRYTAEMICDELGIPYNAGGTTYHMQRALSNHGINYRVSSSKISFSTYMSNLNSDKPVIMGVIDASARGHALVGYGYYTSNIYLDGDIYYYNPNGFFKSTQYGSTFNTSGYVFTWIETVYY